MRRDLFVLRPPRGVVHVENPAGLAALPALGDRTGLARLIARGRVAVRHLVAVSSHDLAAPGEGLSVGAAGRRDAVLPVDHDRGPRQAVQNLGKADTGAFVAYAHPLAP